MVQRVAGTRDPNAAAIYITPLIFVKGVEKKGKVEIVYPEEGLFSQPIALIVKKDYDPRNEPLIEWLLSKEVGQIFADNHFPSTHPEVENDLPKDMSATWVGWDYLYDNDIASLEKELIERFNRLHRPGMC